MPRAYRAKVGRPGERHLASLRGRRRGCRRGRERFRHARDGVRPVTREPRRRITTSRHGRSARALRDLAIFALDRRRAFPERPHERQLYFIGDVQTVGTNLRFDTRSRRPDGIGGSGSEAAASIIKDVGARSVYHGHRNAAQHVRRRPQIQHDTFGGVFGRGNDEEPMISRRARSSTRPRLRDGQPFRFRNIGCRDGVGLVGSRAST
jgi:hypothetical protein